MALIKDRLNLKIGINTSTMLSDWFKAFQLVSLLIHCHLLYGHWTILYFIYAYALAYWITINTKQRLCLIYLCWYILVLISIWNHRKIGFMLTDTIWENKDKILLLLLLLLIYYVFIILHWKKSHILLLLANIRGGLFYMFLFIYIFIFYFFFLY